MQTKLKIAVGLFASVLVIEGFAQGTAFTYQGRLISSGTPASGNYDLTFTLFDSPSSGASVSSFVQLTGVPVSNGLFTVTINTNNEFGATAFNGATRWLEIGVRTNCGCLLNFTTLTPRQPLTPTPYAIFAETVNTNGLAAGAYTSAVNLNNVSNSFSGSFTGNGANVTNVNATTLGGVNANGFWKTNGNAGANPTNGAFLGTTDNLPLEFRVNNERAMRFAYASNSDGSVSANIIGGYQGNSVSNGVIGATIAGGGVLGFPNQVLANFGTVAGGGGNIASELYATAMGGGSTASAFDSTAMGVSTASGAFSTAVGAAIASGFASLAAGTSSATNNYGVALGYQTIAGGAGATALGSQTRATGNSAIAAGNTSTASGDHATAMGDSDANGFGATALGNSIAASTNSTAMGNSITVGNYSTAMGQSAATASFATAMGKASATGTAATASGDSKASGDTSVALGRLNTASAFGATAFGADSAATANYAVAIGDFCGASNTAAFALGSGAKAIHSGCFVWSDYSSAEFSSFSSTAANQFLINATGGMGVGVNNPAAALHVASASSTPELQITQNNSTDYTRLRMNVGSFQPWEMDVSPGASPRLEFWAGTRRMYIDFAGNVTATSFNPTSDRNAKEHFAPVNARAVLDKVAALPITRWNFKEDTGATHIGPMAQDFHAAFDVGMDDKHIATVDADGVALAAIQGLNQKLEDQRAENASLKSELDKLKQVVDKLANAKE